MQLLINMPQIPEAVSTVVITNVIRKQKQLARQIIGAYFKFVIVKLKLMKKYSIFLLPYVNLTSYWC